MTFEFSQTLKKKYSYLLLIVVVEPSWLNFTQVIHTSKVSNQGLPRNCRTTA